MADPEIPNALSGMTPERAMAKINSGKARKMSISRLRNASTQPPKKPEMTPRVVPMTTDRNVARIAMSSEMRAP